MTLSNGHQTESTTESGASTDDSDSDALTIAQQALGKANDLRDEVAALREENQELRQRVAELENRTSLLDLVEDDGGTVDERAVVLLQNLYNEAWADKERSHLKNVRPTAALDYNGAKRALGGTVTTRQQLYDAMERAVQLVYGHDVDPENPPADRPVVEFIKETRTSEQNTRLVVDLDGVDRIELTNGTALTPPTEGDR